jgi:hypothetical protein
MEWETFPVGTLHTQDHPIMTLFNIGQKFKPRNVCGMAQSRFIEPHDCEDIAEWRIKYDNAQMKPRLRLVLQALLDHGPMTVNQPAAIVPDIEAKL